MKSREDTLPFLLQKQVHGTEKKGKTEGRKLEAWKTTSSFAC
jgi:hypothetical protein